MRTEKRIQKKSRRETDRAMGGECESALISVDPRTSLSLLAQCGVGPGPNQSDNTFEILNSFLVNQPSPFHGCPEQITGSTLLTISPNRLLPCQSHFKIPIQPRSSLIHSQMETHMHTQILLWTHMHAHAFVFHFPSFLSAFHLWVSCLWRTLHLLTFLQSKRFEQV